MDSLTSSASNASNLTYSDLQTTYNDFSLPQAQITLGGKIFSDKSDDMIISDINVELTCGFEASVARFRIFNVYDSETGTFLYSDIKSLVLLGTSLTIDLGYLGTLQTVFVGFVSGVTFGFDASDLPYIEVTGMDIKGIMMAGTYAKQLTSNNYGDAVSEILKATGSAYDKLSTTGGISSIQVTATPDKSTSSSNSASSYTVEMASESDYEFIVRAAKKFNYEFFVDRGTVYFRKAKSNTTTLMTLGSGSGLVNFQIEYSITGLVGTVQARATNVGEAKLISSKSTFSNTMSTGSKAKALVKGATKTLIDPTINSQSQADARVSSLMERMSYRLGSLHGDCVGLPDLVPGRFITLSGLGSPVDNDFYLTSVIHDFTNDTGFKTSIVGCAAQVKT